MSHYNAEATEIVDAPVESVYAILRDYHQGHRSILPARYFTDMNVIQGGEGEGTVVTVHMKIFGRRTSFRMNVTEPTPGRVLVEEDDSAGVVTTFRLKPVDGDRQTRVTIATEAKASPGLRGVLERLTTPPIMRKIYRKELRLLSEVLHSKNAH